MSKHIVSIRVQVIVEANSPEEAQRIAFDNAKTLIASSRDIRPTSAEYVGPAR
jgi:hypothetical protein